MKMNILITGQPGVGKTTLIRKLAGRLLPESYAGFYTAEIREKGWRRGFRIATFDGVKKIFAHDQFDFPHRVSRYGVDITTLEEVICHLQQSKPSEKKIWLIDEIGKMESFSQLFRKFIENLLDSDNRVIATISISAGGWIAAIRSRPDVQIFTLTERNREEVFNQLFHLINRPS